MRPFRGIPGVTLLITALASGACSDDPITPPPPPAEVVLTSINVTAATTMITKGQTTSFIATGVYSDNTTKALTAVAWTSSDPAIAAVSATGVATALAAGDTEISATVDQITGRARLTVTPSPLSSIAVTPLEATIIDGQIRALIATGTFEDGTTMDVSAVVAWTSSNPAVATVANGVVTAVAPGNALITAGSGAELESNAVAITVVAEPPEDLLVDAPADTLPLGRTAQVIATAIFAGGTRSDVTGEVAWHSSAENIATVDATGLVTALGEGFVSIRATHSSGVGSSVSIRVTPPEVMAITVSPGSATAIINGEQEFEASALYTDGVTRELGNSVTWSSSSPAIATIDNSPGNQGVAVGVSIGSVTITARHPATGVTGTASLEVIPPQLVAVLINPPAITVAAGLTTQLNAFGIYTDNSGQNISNSVMWSSSDPLIATVDADGTVTALAVGTVTISVVEPVTGIDSNNSNNSTLVTVDPPILLAIAVSPGTASMVIGSSQQFTATGQFSDGIGRNMTNAVTWRSTAPAVTINATGLGTAAALGSARVIAVDPVTTRSSEESNQSASVLVANASLVSIAVNPRNMSFPPGADVQFTAIGTYNNNSTVDLTTLVEWTSSNTAVAVVSNASGIRGLAGGVAPGTATIRARDTFSGISSDDLAQSAVATVPAGVTVTSIAVNATDTTIAPNDLQPFTALGTFSDASTFPMTNSVSWSTSTTNVATVSNVEGSRGVVTGVAVGTAVISATHVPTGVSSNNSSQSRTIVVERNILIADVVHYELDEGTGTIATNLAPSGINGTINGAVTWLPMGPAPGVSPFALRMENSSTNNINANLGSPTFTNLTIEFWWRFGTGTGLSYMWNSNSSFRALTNGVAGAGIWVRNTPGGVDVVHSPSVQNGLWHHIAYVLDASAAQGRLYVNGALSGTTAYSGTITLPNWFLAGQGSANGAQVSYDRYRVWSSAMTAAQIGEVIAGQR